MNNRRNELYIFSGLAMVMLLTISLNFVMNIKFIQTQLMTNMEQEIEYTRDSYASKLSTLIQNKEIDKLEQIFIEDDRTSKFKIKIFNSFGKNIAGNSKNVNQGLNPIIRTMLSGKVDTLLEDHVFYSFKNVLEYEEELYVMVEMSDQRLRQALRSYYLRMMITMLLVSAFILLLGFKLINRLDMTSNKEKWHGKVAGEEK